MSSARRICLAAALTAGVWSAERWARRTRATPAERSAELAGDELVPSPMWQATRAITIDARPEQVWPWLVQMGFPTHRAGWYTPFWLDRILFGIKARSADRVIPELQDLAVGDRVLDSDAGNTYFTVARVDRQHALVLHSRTHTLPVYRDVNFAWAFILREAGSATRLLMRARITYTPVGPRRVVELWIATAFSVGDVLQAGGMLEGIKRRSEITAAAP